MPPYPIEWLDQAKAHVRRLDRAVAMHIFERIEHHARTGSGDVMPLHGDHLGAFRLRAGDYRVICRLQNKTMRIFAVLHRSEAYR